MLGFIQNRLFRGCATRVASRLLSDLDVEGSDENLKKFLVRHISLAISHACAPNRTWGDKGSNDAIVERLCRFTPRPCEKTTARRHLREWLDQGTISTAEAVRGIWGMEIADFGEKLMDEFW
jgi:hypothetical protein